ALPKKLADEAAILNMAKSPSVADGFRAMMPSLSPTMIAMKYKGRIYSPLVIESIGQPMNSPVDKYGKYAELTIPMTLCTLTAIDRDDWAAIYNAERTG
ncbi:hypothetical protein, partial [Propionivibrio sp.]|uniref:hypothetical protein n=1 Tax=Propionivibrio sp. TaxID=2212460 RepID=UPI003BF24868